MDKDPTTPFRPLDITGGRAEKIAPSVFTPLNITKPTKTRLFDFGQSPRNLFDFLPSSQKGMVAVTTTGQQIVIETPPYWQLPPMSRRQFLLLLATAGTASAYAYLKSLAPPLLQAPAAALQPPRLIEPRSVPAPAINPVGVKPNPLPAIAENPASRISRSFAVLQPATEASPTISTSFLPNLMLNQTAFAEGKLNTIIGEPIVRNSLRIAPFNDPNDRSLADYISDKFDDPAYGYIQGDKLKNYSPPKELPGGVKEYALLDEKGPTMVNWMWFTNKNYQDHYAAMGNIRIYVDDKLAINMPAKDFFRADQVPRIQGYTWTFNQANATGCYYPIYGSKSLKICFTEQPQWFDIRGMKFKEPLAGMQGSFSQPVSTTEIKSARNMQALKDKPEDYIYTIDGVERRHGIIIPPNEKNSIEFNSQFKNGTSVDSFHLIIGSQQLAKLGNVNIYIDSEKTISVPVADLFHVSYDQAGKLVDHKSLFAGVIRQDDGTAELYLNIPFSFRKNVKFEFESTSNTDLTVQGRFKTTDKLIPAKLCISSQEGSEVNIKGKGKILQLDWDITTPRKYTFSDGTVSDIDEVFDQNPTTVLDGYEEKSTGDEDWTGHGFYWALWSTHSALPGGMVFTRATDQQRQTRFYRQYLSDFEGAFNQAATLKLPVPQTIKDKVKIRSTVMYYNFETPSIAEPVSEIVSNNEPFYIGVHCGEMYLLNNLTGYPIGVRTKVLQDYARRFALANPQIIEGKKPIPMLFNIDPVFIRAGLLSELMIKARENNIRPILIIKASIDEARGIDLTSKNRGKTLAEDIEDAIRMVKKIDKNYPPLRLAFTNEPNFNKDDPWGNMGWTGNGNPEGGGKAIYDTSMLFSKSCPDCEIYLPALTVVGRNEAIMKAAKTYAREFWEEVLKKGLPANIKGIFANAFGYDPIQTLTDVPVTLDVWYDEAKTLNVPQEKIPSDFFVSEIGPGDKEGQGNDFENTGPFLEELAQVITEVKAKSGQRYEFINNHNDSTIRKIIETIAKAKGIAFFTWKGGGDDMTFHPEIKFRFK